MSVWELGQDCVVGQCHKTHYTGDHFWGYYEETEDILIDQWDGLSPSKYDWTAYAVETFPQTPRHYGSTNRPEGDHEGDYDDHDFQDGQCVVVTKFDMSEVTDVDGDLLNNHNELNGTFQDSTDPWDPDCDDDDFDDCYEATYGTDPHDPDSDDDGMEDGWEYTYDLDPLDDTDASEDPDGDGLSNVVEFTSNTNPTLWDTDEDTYDDYAELEIFDTDPTDSNDHPSDFPGSSGNAHPISLDTNYLEAMQLSDVDWVKFSCSDYDTLTLHIRDIQVMTITVTLYSVDGGWTQRYHQERSPEQSDLAYPWDGAQGWGENFYVKIEYSSGGNENKTGAYQIEVELFIS